MNSWHHMHTLYIGTPLCTIKKNKFKDRTILLLAESLKTVNEGEKERL